MVFTGDLKAVYASANLRRGTLFGPFVEFAEIYFSAAGVTRSITRFSSWSASTDGQSSSPVSANAGDDAPMRTVAAKASRPHQDNRCASDPEFTAFASWGVRSAPDEVPLTIQTETPSSPIAAKGAVFDAANPQGNATAVQH